MLTIKTLVLHLQQIQSFMSSLSVVCFKPSRSQPAFLHLRTYFLPAAALIPSSASKQITALMGLADAAADMSVWECEAQFEVNFWDKRFYWPVVSWAECFWHHATANCILMHATPPLEKKPKSPPSSSACFFLENVDFQVVIWNYTILLKRLELSQQVQTLS